MLGKLKERWKKQRRGWRVGAFQGMAGKIIAAGIYERYL